MTDTSTTAAEPVVEQIDTSGDNANAADLHIEQAAGEGEAEADAGETAEVGDGTATTETTETETPAKPPKEDWKTRRFKQETAKRHDAERKLEAAQALIESMRNGGDGEDAKPELTEAEVERRANVKAQEIASKTGFQAAVQKTLSTGAAEFTDFNDHCNMLADMGANDRPEFLQAIVDEDNGHKLLQHLGQNPEEAERILSLPSLKMAAAIAKLSVEIDKPKPPKPVSAAPAPIKPIDGRARVAPAPDKMSDAEFDAFFAEKEAKRRAAR